MNIGDLRDPIVRQKVQTFIRAGKLDSLTEAELTQLYLDLDNYERATRVEAAANNLIPFCKWMNPDYRPGKIHYMIAEKLEAMEAGKLTRLAISMAPRHGKSMLCSELFPAWYLGRNPTKKLMGASNTTSLAEEFGRKVRNHVDCAEFAQLYPTVKVSRDSSSAGRWATNKGGEAFYAGVGTGIAGRGSDLFVIDDPFSEQDVLSGTEGIYEKVYQWYLTGPRQRLMPNGSICIIHTRWAKSDLIGRLIEDGMLNDDADQFEVLELPAILPSGASIWPEQWSAVELNRMKATLHARGRGYLWDAQYQQKPSGAGKQVIDPDDFMNWEKKDPPICDYILLTLDAAVEKGRRADYNVWCVWGIFFRECDIDPETLEPINQIILLDMVRLRLEFPELKEKTREIMKDYKPDLTLIEKKANGAPLIQELRRSGISVSAFEPGQADKAVRLDAITDIIKSGLVWLPKTFAWAQTFLSEVCGFPNEPHDDCVDNLSIALTHLRKGGFVRLHSDDLGDDDKHWYNPHKVAHYGAR